jgi:hypothetical protein
MVEVLGADYNKVSALKRGQTPPDSSARPRLAMDQQDG